MKWVYVALAIVVGLVALVAVVGALLPVQHSASRRIRLAQPQSAIFAALTDIAAMPQWRTGLQSVTMLPARDGKPCWREVSDCGAMDLMLELQEPDRQVVTRIITERSPFGGTWTFRLAPVDGGTEVTVTEDGEIYHVMFRALARFVFGYTSSMDGYLRSLAAKFGETAQPGA